MYIYIYIYVHTNMYVYMHHSFCRKHGDPTASAGGASSSSRTKAGESASGNDGESGQTATPEASIMR